MFEDGRPLDLLAVPADAPGWVQMTIPGGTPQVRLLRLHVDRATKASVSLVVFPAGWRRPDIGHYLSGEEFVVLQGSLTVSGAEHEAGQWVWVPPLATRSDSSAPRGALALAWFSGPATWRDGEGEPAATAAVVSARPVPGPLRVRRPGVPGESCLLAELPTGAEPVERELLSLADARWILLPAHRISPPLAGPVLVRHWS